MDAPMANPDNINEGGMAEASLMGLTDLNRGIDDLAVVSELPSVQSLPPIKQIDLFLKKKEEK